MTVLIGTNTAEASSYCFTNETCTKLFGQKSHVFDIRKHEMAERADAFYQPKPGTDLVWLGCCNEIYYR